jgi:hypothetical protein
VEVGFNAKAANGLNAKFVFYTHSAWQKTIAHFAP